MVLVIKIVLDEHDGDSYHSKIDSFPIMSHPKAL